MPPPSPAPGCTRGDVWSEIRATRCTRTETLVRCSTFPDSSLHSERSELVGLLGDETLVHVEQGVLLLGREGVVTSDRFPHARGRLVARIGEQTGPHVQRLDADLQRVGQLL